MVKMKVAAYCRVSTDKDSQLNSLDSQKKYFEEYIERNKEWKLVEIYYDEGISGTQTKNRAGFMRMIEDAKNGMLDLILTKEVSRFARNTVDTLSYTRDLKEYGVGVVFTIDNIDSRDADGELRLTIMASLAQEESRKTSTRVRWGQLRQMEKGVVFGRDLLGYTVKDGKLSVNEREAEIVRTIFHMYTNEGKGTHVIARELLERGMKPKRIKLWRNTIILRVLRNEKYVGDLCQKKTITPNYLTHAKKYNRGEEEMVYLYNHHEPIISRELWDRTQEELKKRSPSDDRIRKHSNRYWCSGRLYCGICNERFVSRKKTRKDGSIYKSWRCFAAANHGRSKLDADGNEVGCSNQQYNEDALLFVMKYCIQQIQINREQIKKEIIRDIRLLQQEGNHDTGKVLIETEIQKVRNKKRKLIELMLDDSISKEDAEEMKSYYDEELESLHARMEVYKNDEKIRKNQAGKMEEYLVALDEIMGYNILEETSVPEQFYREMLDKMILFPEGRVQVHLKCIPFGIEVKIKSSGKRECYTTEVMDMKIITNEKEIR